MTPKRPLFLTILARTDPDMPACTAISAPEIAVLEASTRRPVRTLAEAVLAIAILACHEAYRNAPAPGVKRLWQGLRRLADMTAGYVLAHDAAAFQS